MTATVRYKYVLNTTGDILSSSDISNKDGDDKQYKVVKRILAAEDIGTNPGQTHHQDGALVCNVDLGVNILSIEGLTYRGGRLADNLIRENATAASIVQASVTYAKYTISTSQQIRVIDAGAHASVQLAEGDIVILKIVIGTTPDS